MPAGDGSAGQGRSARYALLHFGYLCRLIATLLGITRPWTPIMVMLHRLQTDRRMLACLGVVLKCWMVLRQRRNGARLLHGPTGGRSCRQAQQLLLAGVGHLLQSRASSLRKSSCQTEARGSRYAQLRLDTGPGHAHLHVLMQLHVVGQQHIDDVATLRRCMAGWLQVHLRQGLWGKEPLLLLACKMLRQHLSLLPRKASCKRLLLSSSARCCQRLRHACCRYVMRQCAADVRPEGQVVPCGRPSRRPVLAGNSQGLVVARCRSLPKVHAACVVRAAAAAQDQGRVQRMALMQLPGLRMQPSMPLPILRRLPAPLPCSMLLFLRRPSHIPGRCRAAWLVPHGHADGRHRRLVMRCTVVIVAPAMARQGCR